MHAITDADRDAAEALRRLLADLSGFWFRPGDDSPLVAALARHRIEAERRLADKLSPFVNDAPVYGPRRPASPQKLLPAPKGSDLGPIAA